MDDKERKPLYPDPSTGRRYTINWLAVRTDYTEGRYENIRALAAAHKINEKSVFQRMRKDKERGIPWTRTAVVLPLRNLEPFEPVPREASVGEKAAAMLLRDIELGLEMRQMFQEEMRRFRGRTVYAKPNLEAQALFNFMESYVKMAQVGREIAGRLKGQASVRPEDEAAAEQGKSYVVAIIPEGLGEEEKAG